LWVVNELDAVMHYFVSPRIDASDRPTNLPRNELNAYHSAHRMTDALLEKEAPWNQAKSDRIIEHGEPPADQRDGSPIDSGDQANQF
jgi:hypothetical protein